MSEMESRSQDDDQPLFTIASETIKSSLFYTEKPSYVRENMVFGCILLDSYFDNYNKCRVSINTALGASFADIKLGIFGSHLMHAWPEHKYELVGRFTDSRPLDMNQLADDDSPNKFRALNTGIGAFLHEIGHAHSLSNLVFSFIKLIVK